MTEPLRHYSPDLAPENPPSKGRGPQALARRLPWRSVLITGLVFSGLTGLWIQSFFKERATEAMRVDRDTIAATVEADIGNAFQAINAVAAFVTTHPALTEREYRNFYEASRMGEKFPAIRAVAWAPKVEGFKRVDLMRALNGSDIRSEMGYPPFAIKPSGRRDLYFPAVLVEPHHGNDRVFGYDLWSDPDRRLTAEKAGDSGLPHASPPVVLTQDSGSTDRSMLYLVPVYGAGVTLLSTGERREHLLGFIAAGVTLSRLIGTHALASASHGYRIRISEKVRPTDNLAAEQAEDRYLLFDSATRAPDRRSETPPLPDMPRIETADLEVAGRQWRLEVIQEQDLLDSILFWGPGLSIFLFGGVVSLLLARIVHLLKSEAESVAEALSQNERLFRSLFLQAPDGILVFDENWCIIDSNPAACALLSDSEQAPLVADSLDQILVSDGHEGAFSIQPRAEWRPGVAGGGKVHFEGVYRRADGSLFPVEASMAGVAAGSRRLVLNIFRDISDRRAAEVERVRLAHYDSLTGIANRALFLDRMHSTLARAKRSGESVALLFIDLDNFKKVNDTLGHALGDELLIEAARRIQDCIRQMDGLARLGGDEFLVTLPDLHDTQDAERVAKKIIAAFEDAFLLGERRVHVTPSIGYALFPRDGDAVQSLLKSADTAMYAAKRAGRNRVKRFIPSMEVEAQRALDIETEIRSAMANGEFTLAYQPLIETRSGRLLGAEALLRWDNPSLGKVPPDQFIGIAEDTGLILPIGSWVMDQALGSSDNLGFP